MTKRKTPDQIASEYTHSVWTGKAYSRPQTEAELIAESKAKIARFMARNGLKLDATGTIVRGAR